MQVRCLWIHTSLPNLSSWDRYPLPAPLQLETKMIIYGISDTHMLHNQLEIPQCDILIHAGDFSDSGRYIEACNFMAWLSSLDQVKHKIVIAGNHDKIFQKSPTSVKEIVPSNITYLQDSEIIIEGLKIYGTPWTPFFCDWAFNGLEEREEQGYAYSGGPGRNPTPDAEHLLLSEVYSKIPDDTSILICHGPADVEEMGTTREGIRVGSRELRKRCEKIPGLKAVISGHIHEGQRYLEVGKTKYYNVSSCNRDYRLVNAPTRILV